MTPSRLRPTPFDPRDPTICREERKLWAAVIADAILCVQRERIVGVEFDEFLAVRNAAATWLLDDSDRMFGFVWCCHVIGADPEWARRVIAKGGRIAVTPRGHKRHFIVVRGGRDSEASERSDSALREARRTPRALVAQVG